MRAMLREIGILVKEDLSNGIDRHDHAHGIAHNPLSPMLQLQIWMQLAVLMLLSKTLRSTILIAMLTI
mgnify:CR=1 FL=1